MHHLALVRHSRAPVVLRAASRSLVLSVTVACTQCRISGRSWQEAIWLFPVRPRSPLRDSAFPVGLRGDECVPSSRRCDDCRVLTSRIAPRVICASIHSSSAGWLAADERARRGCEAEQRSTSRTSSNCNGRAVGRIGGGNCLGVSDCHVDIALSTVG